MKKMITLVAAIIMFSATYAQNEQPDGVEKVVHKINIIPITYSWEAKIAKTQTVMLQPAIGLNWISSGAVVPSIQLNAFFRHYYNFNKRIAKGKRTTKNSANWVGAVMSFSFWNAAWSNNISNDDYIPYWAVGPVWGIQRNYRSHFSLGITLGPTISVGNRGFRADAYVELTLGFWLGK